MDQRRWLLRNTRNSDILIMKYVHSIIFTFIAMSLGCSPAIPDLQIHEKDGDLSRTGKGLLLYKAEPFSGHLMDYYHDGRLKSVTPYKNGLRESISRGYYPTGELMYERPYSQGKKNGTHTGYFPGGQQKFRYEFEAGLSVGNHREWYSTGQLASDLNYLNGHPLGPQKVWRPDGKIRSNYVIREDGRRYGLVGIRRCKNLDTENERIAQLTAAVYEK